jgi:hypothetical protein
VGGLVPTLLIDHAPEAEPRQDPHPGTLDLDVALSERVVDEQRYQALALRLRQEGFGPDVSEGGNKRLQSWRNKNSGVVVEFLMDALGDGQDPGRRVQPLEADFGVFVTDGAELAIDERVERTLTGRLPTGEEVTRTISVCGPAAFVVLKTLALAGRGEPKDAFDLIYVLRGTPGAPGVIADRLAGHAEKDPDVVRNALAKLAHEFASIDSTGPKRAAEFMLTRQGDQQELDNAASDAHGLVADLLEACLARGLTS